MPGQLSPELSKHIRTLPVCTGRRHHGSHPSQLQRGERRAPGEERARPCRTKQPASSQEPGLGGGGASGMAERPALRGRGANAYLEAEASRTPAVQHASPSPPVTEGTRSSPVSQRAAEPTATLCQAPPLLPAPALSHNSHHQLPFTCCGLTSLSCFPLSRVRKCWRTAGTSAVTASTAQPERCHSGHSLPYKFYSQKSLKTTKKKTSLTPQRQVT